MFNRVESLKMAIGSVLAQSYQHWELIIVDDCSTLDIEKEVKSFDDSRIIFMRLNKNSGAAAARNFGIKNSEGKIISFLDSDDFFEPEFLKISVNTLRDTEPEVGYMWTGSRLIFKNKTKESVWAPAFNRNSYLTFLENLQVGAGGVSIKREVFNLCGYFNVDLPASEDTEFFLRISKDFEYTFTPEILINIRRDTSDRMSTKFYNIAAAYNKFLPNHFVEIDNDPKLKMKYYYKMMWLNYHIHDKQKARYYYNKIPFEWSLTRIKCDLTKFLYESMPIDVASSLHQKISSY